MGREFPGIGEKRPPDAEFGRVREKVELDLEVGGDPALAQDLAALDRVFHLPVRVRDFFRVEDIIVEMGIIALEGPAARRVISGDRQGHGRILGQREHLLDQAFSPGILAQDQAAVMIHDRPGDDLGGAGAALADENDHGNPLVLTVPAAG